MPYFTASADNQSLCLKNVTLSFNQLSVLTGVDLAVAKGQHVALTGKSGAGKTSLIAIISGLIKPTEGQVHLFGQNITDMNEHQLANLRQTQIGIVFQHFHLLPTMTAIENVALPLELAKRKDAQKRAYELLSMVGLNQRCEHFPQQLSGGEQQRVAIARAFIANPPLVLADEPTGNLDEETGKMILSSLFELAREHDTTLFFVTHNRAILSNFDQVLSLEKGQLVTTHLDKKTDSPNEHRPTV